MLWFVMLRSNLFCFSMPRYAMFSFGVSVFSLQSQFEESVTKVRLVMQLCVGECHNCSGITAVGGQNPNIDLESQLETPKLRYFDLYLFRLDNFHSLVIG